MLRIAWLVNDEKKRMWNELFKTFQDCHSICLGRVGGWRKPQRPRTFWAWSRKAAYLTMESDNCNFSAVDSRELKITARLKDFTLLSWLYQCLCKVSEVTARKTRMVAHNCFPWPNIAVKWVALLVYVLDVPYFRFQHRDWLCWHRSPTVQMMELYLRLDHDYFLPYLLPFNTGTPWLSLHLTLCSLDNWQ